MKPIKLIMSAFGSYADETIIDFTVTNRGLFLITGDTGSGKTTIFDAICYALYDKTSGGSREGTDMRSQYADSELATFVEYTFLYGDDIYTIKRNPKYTRVSKRRDKDGNLKETTELPGVELTMPDGRIFQGKIKETNEKIVEIIGLDAEQFTQIVMIAQGEFMKLLQATSNKRKEIFGRIFNTKIYSQIQESLRQQSKAIYGELEDNRKICEAVLQSIKQIPDTEEYPLTFSEHDNKELMDNIDRIIEIGKGKEKEYNNQLKICQNSLEEKTIAVNAGKENNALFDSLQKAIEQKDKLTGEFDNIKADQLKIELAQKAQKVEKEDKFYQKIRSDNKECESNIVELEKNLENAMNMLEKSKDRLNHANEEKEKNEVRLTTQIDKIKEMLPKYKEADNYKNSMSKLDEKISDSQKNCNHYMKMLEQAKGELVNAHDEASLLLSKYQHENDLFIASIAGIMAKELQEGTACPVCGSITHPCKAHLSEDSVTEQQVNKSKDAWNKAEKKERKLTQDNLELTQKYNKSYESLLEIQNEKKAINLQHDIIKDKLEYEDEQTANKKLAEITNQLEAINNEAKDALDTWQIENEKVISLRGSIKAQQNNLDKLKEELKNSYTVYVKILKENGFKNEEEYLESKLSDAQIQVIEERITAYNEKVSSNQGQIILLESQTKGKERVDTDSIQAELSVLYDNKRQLEKIYKNIYAINENNKEKKNKIKDILSRRTDLKQRYTIYNNMDKTANGNLAGVAKLDFQTYIQRRYFEIMIKEANKRLIKMTNNQFILQCRSLEKLGSQGAVGLDIDVYSLVNDKARDVKTLSGGESFMAALSMALGMSDVIQNTAGKVKMDTMFVDEGFGSLDDDSRTEAIKILLELAGDRRLVGIISHVTELKEQIDKKLIVKKDERGSKAYWSEIN